MYKTLINRRRFVGFPYFWHFLILGSLSLISIVFVYLTTSVLPPQVPLFYGRPFGEAQLADSTMLILPFLFSFIFSLISFTISIFMRDQFLQRVFLGLGAITYVLSFITVLRIILLVGNL